MTRDRSVDERISAWLRAEAPEQLPDRVLQATFERTRPSPQRPSLPGWKRFPIIHTTPTRIGVVAAGLLVLIVGFTLLPQSNPSVSGDASPLPSATPSASPTPRPTPEPSLSAISLSGQIAFERTVGGNTDLYLMNLDRTGLMRLTNDPSADVNPNWSPDGKRIVFRRIVDGASDLFVMNADGSDATRLTASPQNELDGRFSPDGESIAFWRSTDVAAELRLMDPDGSNDRLVVRFEATFPAGIGWTADGRAILFNKGIGRTTEIVRIDLVSKAMTTLTGRPEDNGRFAVSNDGSTIAFQSDRLPAGIYLMGVDGSDVRHLAVLSTTGSPASWSPDGGYLVASQPDGWLYLVRTDTGEVTRWTEGGLEVAWRP